MENWHEQKKKRQFAEGDVVVTGQNDGGARAP
jgi:hypothetical protein